MFTSFFQYLLLLPSYVNILLIYAFCNLHDVSWGTKGDNGSAKDLGQVKITTKNGEKVAEVKSTRQEDIEDLYRQAKAELRIPMEHVKEKRSQETKRQDADRNFRTHIVLWFLGVNMVIILVLTSNTVTEWLNTKFNPDPAQTHFNPYLVSGLATELLIILVRGVSRTPIGQNSAKVMLTMHRKPFSGPSSPFPPHASRAVFSISSSIISAYNLHLLGQPQRTSPRLCVRCRLSRLHRHAQVSKRGWNASNWRQIGSYPFSFISSFWEHLLSSFMRGIVCLEEEGEGEEIGRVRRREGEGRGGGWVTGAALRLLSCLCFEPDGASTYSWTVLLWSHQASFSKGVVTLPKQGMLMFPQCCRV